MKSGTAWYGIWFVSGCLLAGTVDAGGIEEPELLGRIAKALSLPEDKTVHVEQIKEFPYRLPFIGTPDGSGFAVAVKFEIPNAKSSAAMKVYFSDGGRFLRAESLGKVSDPRRMELTTIEGAMRSDNQAFAAVSDAVAGQFNFHEFWRKVCLAMPMEQAREFDVALVSYRDGDESRPVLVVNVWGIENPLQMPDGLPKVLRDRVRAIFTVDGKLYCRDNLL